MDRGGRSSADNRVDWSRSIARAITKKTPSPRSRSRRATVTAPPFTETGYLEKPGVEVYTELSRPDPAHGSFSRAEEECGSDKDTGLLLGGSSKGCLQPGAHGLARFLLDSGRLCGAVPAADRP